MQNLQKAFAFDIRIRRDIDEKFPGSGIKAIATDIREGIVYQANGVKVTAFLVDHRPVKPAAAIVSTTGSAQSSCRATPDHPRTLSSSPQVLIC